MHIYLHLFKCKIVVICFMRCEVIARALLEMKKHLIIK